MREPYLCLCDDRLQLVEILVNEVGGRPMIPRRIVKTQSVRYARRILFGLPAVTTLLPVAPPRPDLSEYSRPKIAYKDPRAPEKPRLVANDNRI